MMENKLIISPSPHIHSGDSVEKRMYHVLIALVPAFLVSLLFFGLGALIVTSVSVLACVAFEWLIQRFLLKQPTTISDGSAVITGVLLAFNLPSNLPLWIVIIGALVAIGIGKMAFGGLGNNIFNPALVGRVFLLISFPAQMTVWPEPSDTFFPMTYLDAVTGPTTLAMMENHFGTLPDYQSLLVGKMGGSLGEVSAVALLLGFVYLLWKKVIRWYTPIYILATVLVFTGILHLIDPTVYASPLLHLLSGGLLLGAIFMATDYTTSPVHKRGKFIYGVGIGVLTVVIRQWGAYPEGMSFAILIMNAFTPLLNMYMRPSRYGRKGVKQHG